MTVRVDAAAGVVVDGDREWPLRLDCRTGAATLTVDGREIAVTPLRWRDKQRLARWAHLGPAFVADQRLTLAVEPGTVLTDAERPLVEAVTVFLNGPDGQTLPLVPELLAEVTVEACRLTGLAPAAFDDRDALDLEAIWRGAPEQMPRSAPGPSAGAPKRAVDPMDPWADATSIVFTPDPSLSAVAAPEFASAPAADPDRSGGPAATPTAPVPDRMPGPVHPADPDATVTPRPPVTARPRTTRRLRALPYRIAVAPVPARPEPALDTPAPREPLPAVLGARAGGPLVAPVAAPPSSPSRPQQWPANPTEGRREMPDGHAPAAWPLADPVTDPADDGDGLDALAAAVAERLADQLAEASADLGIEV